MKKIKYLLALCLSIVCLGAVSAQAAMETTMAEEMTLFESLDFTLPEKTAEEDVVTRGEFIQTITQFIARDFTPGAGYSFTDVPADSALSGHLSYAVGVGMVSDGTAFNPDAPVTYQQAIKMAVVFLGRGAEGEAAGGFPSGYMAVATTYELLGGLQDFDKGNMTLRDFYQLLVNVGQTRMLVSDYNGNLVTGQTPFVEYFNMYQIRGIVNYTEKTSLKDNEIVVPAGCIAVNSDIYRYDGDIEIGYRVEGWARNVAHDMPEILMIKNYKTTTETISLFDLEGYVDAGYFNYYEGGKLKKIKIDSPKLIYNDVAATTMGLSDIYECEFGEVEFINNDDDTGYDVIHVREYKVRVVSSVSDISNRITDQNGESVIDLYNNGKVNGFTILRNGEKIDITDLKAGNLIMVYGSKDGRYYTIEVASGVLSGEVKSLNKTNNTINLSDKRYQTSKYFTKYYGNKIKVGTTINVATTPDGIIHCLTTDVDISNNYGYLLKCYLDDATEKYMLKLTCEDGKVRTVKLGKTLRYDGEVLSHSSVKANIDALRKNDDKSCCLIKYKLNEAMDTVNVIDTHIPAKAETDPTIIVNTPSDNDMAEYTFPTGSTSNPSYSNTTMSFVPYVQVSDAKVFLINISGEVEDEEIFTVGTSSDINKYTQNYGRVPQGKTFADRRYRIYNVDGYGNAEAIALMTNKVGGDISGSDPKGIIYRVSRAANTNGDETLELVLYSNGVYSTHFLNDKCYDNWKKGNAKLETGYYISYIVNNNQEIIATEWIIDCNTKTINPSLLGNAAPETDIPLTGTNYLPHSANGIVPGWLYSTNGKNIAMIPTGHYNRDYIEANGLPTSQSKFEEANLAQIFFGVGNVKVSVIAIDNGKVSIEEGGLADVRMYSQEASKANTDYVICCFRGGNLNNIMVIR